MVGGLYEVPIILENERFTGSRRFLGAGRKEVFKRYWFLHVGSFEKVGGTGVLGCIRSQEVSRR